MNSVDIILALALLYGLVRGFFRGFFAELAALVGIVAGIYGAVHFSQFLSDILANHIEWKKEYLNLVAFALTFILIVFLVSLAGKALTKAASFAALGLINRLLGGIFGLLKSAFVASVIIMFFKATNEHLDFVEQKTLDNSILYHHVEVIAPIILPSIIKQVREKDLLEENDEFDLK